MPAVENYESNVYFVANTRFYQGDIFGGTIIGEGRVLGGVDNKREIEPISGQAVELFNTDPTLKYMTDSNLRKHGFPSFSLLMGDRMPRFVGEIPDESDLWTVMIVGKISYDSGVLPNFLSGVTDEYRRNKLAKHIEYRIDRAERTILASVGIVRPY